MIEIYVAVRLGVDMDNGPVRFGEVRGNKIFVERVPVSI